MEIGLLGPLRLVADDGSARVLAAAKVRTLLAFLLVCPGCIARVDQIVDALWSERPPGSAVNLVQGYIGDLRRILGADRVQTVPGGYRLDLAACSLDSDRFADLVAGQRYRDALALWRGPALAEWADRPWAQATAIKLEEERLSVLERALAADLDAGSAASVTGEIAAVVREHPLRERFQVLLIKALYQCGRQADALAAYRDARRILADEIGIEPGPELQALQSAVLGQDPSLTPPRPAGAAALPTPTTPLLGRHSVLAQLHQLLTASRLVTVTGPGGVGKTHLAIAACRADRQAPRIWFTELVSSTSAQQVAPTVATVMRLAQPSQAGTELIVDYLQNTPGLLVLDNCEHLIESVAGLVSTLLRSCPDLRVLATSREPLRLAGERVLPLDGLATGPAAELFRERAYAANPHADLAGPIVDRIVRRLDGLPLAVELAGARTLSLTVEQIEAGLSTPLDLLASESRDSDVRHRTIRTVIGWSYDLLPAEDRATLAALSVFVGPFTLPAANQVGGAGAGGIERLLSRCLLARGADVAGQARYRMLEIVRQFAAEQADPTELRRARLRHLAFHVSFARELHAGLRSAESPAWATRGRGLAADLREAVHIGLEQRHPGVGILVADLFWLWFLDGRLGEVRSWIEHVDRDSTDRHTQARLDRCMASACIAQGDVATAERAAARLLAASRRLGDDEHIALALNLQGMIGWARGDPAALEHHHAAMNHARRVSRPWVLVLVTALAGRSAHAAADHAAGERLLAEAVRLGEQLGEPMVLGSALDYQAHAAFAVGTLDHAARLTQRAMHAYRQIGYQEGIASAGTLAGLTALLTGHQDRARRLLAESLDVCQRLGHRGGIATIHEATALLHHENGDNRAAIASLAAGRAARRESDTTTPAELAERLRHLESMLEQAAATTWTPPVSSSPGS